jgi:C4-dicarboxylate transporter/malic acid transport protein
MAQPSPTHVLDQNGGDNHNTESQPPSKEASPQNIPIRERLHHLTWASFTLTMSSGGIALLLASSPHRFRGLTTIGTIIFILALFLYVLITILIITRFLLFRGSFIRSLLHPTESLFIPTFLLSFSVLTSNIAVYGIPHTGPWLITTLRVLFWVYAAVTFVIAVGQYHILFASPHGFTPQSATPAWILPMFPPMLLGTLAGVLCSSQPPDQAFSMLVAGLTFQGLGMSVAVFMYSNYIGRLMTAGFPLPGQRPGMMISCGPPSFTALALLRMSQDVGRVLHSPSGEHIIAGLGLSQANPDIISDIFRIGGLTSAVFLWLLAFWFFCITVVAVISGIRTGEMVFSLSWWSFVFPNVGLVLSMTAIGEALGSDGILWVSSVATVILVGVWLTVGVLHVRAIWKRQILWPGKDEDRHDKVK